MVDFPHLWSTGSSILSHHHPLTAAIAIINPSYWSYKPNLAIINQLQIPVNLHSCWFDHHFPMEKPWFLPQTHLIIAAQLQSIHAPASEMVPLRSRHESEKKTKRRLIGG